LAVVGLGQIRAESSGRLPAVHQRSYAECNCGEARPLIELFSMLSCRQ
jgi:hypothetical protein